MLKRSKNKKPGLFFLRFLVSFFKLLWFLFIGFWKSLDFFVEFLRGNVKGSHDLLNPKKPKSPALYTPFSVQDIVKGSFDSFEERLLSDSLIMAVVGRRGSGKSALGFRLLENIHAKAKRPVFVLGVKES